MDKLFMDIAVYNERVMGPTHVGNVDLGIRTLSDLAAHSHQLRIGVGYEFLERRDGYPGLPQTYGLQFAQSPRVMDLGLLYRAIANDDIDVLVGANTDGLIAALGLVVLEDEKRYFPPYDAVPIVRGQTLRKHPEIATALQPILGHITAAEMRQLNYAVDGEKRDAAAVAREHLARTRALSTQLTEIVSHQAARSPG